MRPVRLVLENFASFRGEPVELDFSTLELFAIAGPTGAGKSTLLDAMFFALYGAVPRLGKRANEIISLGADRMSVMFDFRVDGISYRVSRQARRRRNAAATAQLERLDPDGSVHSPTNGVRDVNDEVERILGLSYDAFTQAVILPQGEFQKFLKSEPRERRELLSKILRLEIYRRMQQLASNRRDAVFQTVDERERRLTEDYAHVTPSALEALRGRGEALDADVETRSETLRQTEATRDLARTMRAKTRELERHRARDAELRADETRIRAQQLRIDAARRAAPVIPQVKAAQTVEQRATEAKLAAEAATASAAEAEVAHQLAQERVAEATRAAEELRALDERIVALDRVIGRMQPQPGLAAELDDIRKQRLAAERGLKQAQGELRQAEQDLASAQAQLKKADEQVSAVNFDRAQFELLDGARENISQIFDWVRAADAAVAEVGAAESRLHDKKQALARLTAAAEEARREETEATRNLAELQRRAIDARHLASAALLRAELRHGEPCPVCEHPVTAHPSPLPTPALDTLQKQLAQAQRAEMSARQAADVARREEAGARAAAETEQTGLDERHKHENEAVQSLGFARSALTERVQERLTLTRERTVEEQAKAAYRAAAEARDKHEAAGAARDQAGRTAQQAQQARETAKTAATRQEDRVKELDERVAGLSRQIAEIDAEVRNVTTSADPAAERANLHRRRTGIDAALRTSKDAEAQTASTLSAADARRGDRAKALAQALDDAKTARAATAAAIAAAGFADAAEVLDVELDAAARQEIERAVAAFRDELALAAAQIKTLTAELDGDEVSQQRLDEAEAKAAESRDSLSTAVKERAVVDQQIRHLSEAIQRADALRAQLDELHAKHAVYQTLAHDLRSDRFQAFLLEETFSELVAGASDRLWELTKRYRLDWQNDAFYVLDHDNARQTRSADTLSGGETFLASLALALQLSDQVQKAAGATPLDSLFIDEGFGTLDSETLDAAAAAIESLPVGGRMVGIITHIEELSLRLPARVRVGKTASGSRLILEAG